MAYYPDPHLERIRDAVEAEVRSGVRVLSASYLVRRYKFEPSLVQRVLSDLVAVDDLQIHYRLLCSGEHQRYDVDREFIDRSEIPKHAIVCTKCGDLYTPSEEDIFVFFEPTDGYLNDLQKAS
jgi:hypothetical protein